MKIEVINGRERYQMLIGFREIAEFIKRGLRPALEYEMYMHEKQNETPITKEDRLEIAHELIEMQGELKSLAVGIGDSSFLRKGYKVNPRKIDHVYELPDPVKFELPDNAWRIRTQELGHQQPLQSWEDFILSEKLPTKEKK